MLQAAETLFCQKSTNELLHPAHPEPGSSQAADGTFPANSTAPWKNACTPCQGRDPIRAANAALSERRIQKIKAKCEEPAGEPGFPCFLSILTGRTDRTITERCCANSPTWSQGSSKHRSPWQDTEEQAELHISYTKSIGNRFWLILCSLLMLGL